MDDDSEGSEQLLLNALRAKASQASMPAPAAPPADAPAPPSGGTMTVGWLLIVVALLGLATGAVIGLLTVL